MAGDGFTVQNGPSSTRNTHCYYEEACIPSLLVPQSSFGGKPFQFQVFCPQNGTVALKGLKTLLGSHHPRTASGRIGCCNRGFGVAVAADREFKCLR